jgi:hypothetical protein
VQFTVGARGRARLIVNVSEHFVGELFIDAVEVYDIKQVRRECLSPDNRVVIDDVLLVLPLSASPRSWRR